ncbi:MAG: hypothetical protein ABGZ17_30415 [Planctomycetaceae bacterium]
MKKAQQSRQVQVSDRLLKATTRDVHAGPCPICQGDGPVDAHNVHSIWSALWLTQWKTVPTIGCRSCGSKAQLRGALFSSLLGWWGFPWGVIVTPIQILRNFIGMLFPPHPDHPSDQLQDLLRVELAERDPSDHETPTDDAWDDEAWDDDAWDDDRAGAELTVVKVVCGGCGHAFEVGIQMAGRTDYCPVCGIALTVPEVIESQHELDADFQTTDVDDQWSSTLHQGNSDDGGSADWSDPWDAQWRDVDVRYGGTQGTRSRGSSVASRSGASRSGGRKHPILSLLVWIIVAVMGVATLVCVIGFVLIDDDERPGGAGHPGFDGQPFRQRVPGQMPIGDRGLRLRDFRRQVAPPRPARLKPVLPAAGDRDVNPVNPADAQPKPISEPREMRAARQVQALDFEKMAARDNAMSAWYWKEAARVWLQLKQTDKALAAARKSDDAPPETRSRLLTHFWHRHLGDIYLEVGEPQLAIPHYEAALKSTEIPGDITSVQKSLLEAVQQSQP